MTQKEIIVPYDSMPHIHTETFLTKEQAEQFKDVFKDFVPVVRCKDCKYATMTADGELCKYCENDMDDDGNQREVYHSAYWFCADGERKEGR